LPGDSVEFAQLLGAEAVGAGLRRASPGDRLAWVTSVAGVLVITWRLVTEDSRIFVDSRAFLGRPEDSGDGDAVNELGLTSFVDWAGGEDPPGFRSFALIPELFIS
jgi:hypothetical protein